MTGILLMLTLLGGQASVQPGEEQLTELAQYFGFDTFQIYKIKRRPELLRLGDLDGDGRTDIMLWNSTKNRIELFYQPSGKRDEGRPETLERNEVPNRGPLRNEHLAVTHTVASMNIAELTGDDRPDIVYFGEPKELVILPGRSDGGFGPPITTRAPKGLTRNTAVACADFNSDGRSDVALLTSDAVLIYHQKPGGGLAKPVKLLHNLSSVLLMLPGDLNGDGRTDLVMTVDDDQHGLVAFLQDATGTLGAMRRLKVPRLRSLTIAPDEHGDLVLAVEANTGRLKIYHYELPPADGESGDWPELVYSYPTGTKGKRRPVAIADVTGDGLPDVVAADYEGARLILFKGTAEALEPGVSFPGLMKPVDLQAADIDGDGVAEVLCVSREEKLLGVSRYANGRLTFPEPFEVDGVPSLVAVGPLMPGQPPVLACLTRHEGKNDDDKGTFLSLYELPGGEPLQSWKIEDLKDDPAALWLADVNQDGRNDLLLFVAYSPLVTFLQADDGSFREFGGPRTRSGLVKEAEARNAALFDVTGDGKPELILGQKNLARALVIRDGRWTVIDQYNPESPDTQIRGLTALPGPEGPRLVMYDRKAGELLVFAKQKDDTFSVEREMPIGTYNLTAIAPLPISSSEPALLLADAARLTVLHPGRVAPTLVEKQTYETNTKGAWLADAVVGDVNHDGVRDVIAVDMRKANLEVLTTLPDGRLVKALRFQVFQGKRFSDRPERGGEPHAVLIGDVTGDGCDDIVVLVHDRLIVYPGQ